MSLPGIYSLRISAKHQSTETWEIEEPRRIIESVAHARRGHSQDYNSKKLNQRPQPMRKLQKERQDNERVPYNKALNIWNKNTDTTIESR